MSIRWYVKKAARYCVARSSWAVKSISSTRNEPPRVRALTYHRIGEEGRNPFCVKEDQFASQVQLLAKEGRAISLATLERFLEGQAEVPKDACVLTIDDGEISVLTKALPILEKYNVSATVFVSSGLFGQRIADSNERYMSEAELQLLAKSDLITIGSHAHTHRSIASLSLEEQTHELRNSKKILESMIESEISTFAYPFGTVRDFDQATDALVRDSGFATSFTSIHGSIEAGISGVSLPRVKVEGGETLDMFSILSRGALDRWSFVDQKLSFFQNAFT